MECNGFCHDEKGISFKVMCFGTYNGLPHKLRIFYDGHVNKLYKDVCGQTQTNVKIAFNQDPLAFEIDEDGKMVEFRNIRTEFTSQIAYDNEILMTFFQNFNVTPIWIDCNQTWGWFDEETGHWTGSIGKVSSYFLISFIFYFPD